MMPHLCHNLLINEYPVTATVLNDCALLRFSGPDAPAFLQGQLTCDVLALKPGTSTYGGYCNPKGRLLATFLLIAVDGEFVMMLPAVLAEPVRKRLAMYILRSKVKLEDISATHVACSAPGSRTPSALRLPGNRRLAVLPRDQAGDLAVDSGAWSAADIAAGIPFITPGTQEEFVPQMVNLDLIGGLSYSKGCYPGQEIVARTHYLGRLKQRMYRVLIQADAVAAGQKLYCDALGGQASGMILAATGAGDGRDALAVLQTAHARTSPYHLDTPDGPLLQIGTLPYAVD